MEYEYMLANDYDSKTVDINLFLSFNIHEFDEDNNEIYDIIFDLVREATNEAKSNVHNYITD